MRSSCGAVLGQGKAGQLREAVRGIELVAQLDSLRLDSEGDPRTVVVVLQ